MGEPSLTRPSSESDRGVSPVRVLVVDDFEPFRQFICSTLVSRPELRIIGVASDGLEAIHKAEELQPDLILLDIGLPSLNGIEAARRIRKLSIESKILFVSQESSAEVAKEAFASGALGYVVKGHAGSDLLAAVETVLDGAQFISGIQGHSVIPGEITHRHEAHFYFDDTALVAGFASFIQAALAAGNAAIVVATEPHRKSVLQRLQEQGVDMTAAIEDGSYLALDEAAMLSNFMVNDMPDPVLFLKAAGDLVTAQAKTAKGNPPRVSVCGECAPTLWERGHVDAAVRLEHLCNELAETCGVDILCGYVPGGFQRQTEADTYERICAEHTAVYSW